MSRRHRPVERPTWRWMVMACLVVCLPITVSGDEYWHGLHDEVLSGRLVGMPVILDWLQAHYHGDVLEVELERDDGRIIYEVEMIGPHGQIVEFEFDAVSGELFKMEGVNINSMRKTQ